LKWNEPHWCVRFEVTDRGNTDSKRQDVESEIILVVDDNKPLAEFIVETLLPDLGYKAVAAYDGKSALEILKTLHPSIMLLDQCLPDTNGLDFLRQLARNQQTIPTILVSAYGSEQIAVEAFRLGVQDYLIKPIKIDELNAAIAHALTESHLRRETARLTAQLKEQVSWLNILSEIGRSVTSTLDLDEVLRRIVAAGVDITQAEEGFLALIDSNTNQLYLRAVKNIDEKMIKTLRLPVDDTLVGEVINKGQPIRSSTTEKHSIKVTTGFLVQSVLHVPILSKGHPLGVLSVDHRVTSIDFTDRDKDLLLALADYAAVALENAHLYQQAQHEISERTRAEEKISRKVTEAAALARVVARINAQLDLATVLKTICEEAISSIPSMSAACVLLSDEKKDFLYIAASSGYNEKFIKGYGQIPHVVYERRLEKYGPVMVAPEVSSSTDLSNIDVILKSKLCTLVSISLVHENELIGSLEISSQGKKYIPTEEELAFIQALADQATTAIANARLYEEVLESQKRLQILSKSLVMVQEAERRRLACELHDEIGQKLTSSHLALEILARSVIQREISPSAIRTELFHIQEMLSQLLKQVRDLSLDLRPALLDDLGLLPALLSHFDNYSALTCIQVNFKHSDLEVRFAPEIETAAFRIIQEALTNVARHADVKEVDVRLWANEQILGLQVEDHGKGFDPQAIQLLKPTIGLSGMHERATLCGGQLEVDSEPGSGTCLTAEFPIEEPKQEEIG
jgi:signal transduction histidine kinase/DNA-binding response OmpR family regulator